MAIKLKQTFLRPINGTPKSFTILTTQTHNFNYYVSHTLHLRRNPWQLSGSWRNTITSSSEQEQKHTDHRNHHLPLTKSSPTTARFITSTGIKTPVIILCSSSPLSIPRWPRPLIAKRPPRGTAEFPSSITGPRNLRRQIFDFAFKGVEFRGN
ncbi:unnamed protein product [Citrullus colocynthis]|uniref:Uncharacterized protein n=1 Tax=Citrullus colocynthis TaxID=252529 RepID=A0ABP0XT87_9ROSI